MLRPPYRLVPCMCSARTVDHHVVNLVASLLQAFAIRIVAGASCKT
jgi:hypothetical protein